MWCELGRGRRRRPWQGANCRAVVLLCALAALAACSIAPDRRPQTLSVAEWLALRAQLTPLP